MSSLYFFISFYFLMLPLPPRSTLFPYTTLFRSCVNELRIYEERVINGTVGIAQLIPDCDAHGLYNPRQCMPGSMRSEEHTSELQSLTNLVCRLLLEKKKKKKTRNITIIESK